ncbi:MAG: ATP-binding protein [Chloroflexi bacterium]|nr:ATP-binding protein [Chloroflexota bacterium]
MIDIDRLALLRNAFPTVSEHALHDLAGVARLQEYPADTILCIEGEMGDTFYLIGSGEIEITKQFTDKEERIMRTGKAGDYFGEMALIDDSPRTATIRTLKPTVVLELGRYDFQQALNRHPAIAMTLIRTFVERMRANDTRAIDELRQQKEQLAVAYDELQRQERQRDTFLNTLSHELRTPLTTTSGYIQLLKAGLLSGQTLVNAVDKIDESFKRVISLINDLLFVQQQLTVNFEPIQSDLLEILDMVYAEMKPLADEAGIAVNMRALTPVPLIYSDPEGLKRVFRHLIDNAIKFSPGRSKVDVDVGVKGGNLVVDVKDYGVGITEEFMPRLFKMFERDEISEGHLFDGMGLGLPIALQIVEKHGGKIDVKSQHGEGATFSVKLPLED